MKRFWSAAAAQRTGAGWGVVLDSRPVRTPAGAPLLLPTEALAHAVAAEWAAVEGEVKPAKMRLTGLSNAATDRMGPDQAAALAAYGGSDALCYRAEAPPELAALQAAAWDPILAWAAKRYDVAFVCVTGIVHKPQPAATVARLAAEVTGLPPFRLAGLHPVITITGSLVLGLAVLERHLSADEAWEAGQLDELWQAKRWGEDDLATASRADRRAALQTGAEMLELLD